jgi:hypothetical protein
MVASPAMPAPKLATAIQPPPPAIRIRAIEEASGPMARARAQGREGRDEAEAEGGIAGATMRR